MSADRPRFVEPLRKWQLSQLAPQLKADLLTVGGRARAAQAIADQTSWAAVVELVQAVYKEAGREVPEAALIDQWLDEDVTTCRQFAHCGNRAEGTTQHSVLGPVLSCRRCADKLGFTLTPFPTRKP